MDNQHDVDTIVHPIKRPVQIFEDTHRDIPKYRRRFTDKMLPGCEIANTTSSEVTRFFARFQSVSLDHIIVGTNTMGAEGSSGSVVDTKLRVIGVTGLRVIDASVMPRVPIGNTNAATVMIAERGAEFIINLWKKAADFFRAFRKELDALIIDPFLI